MKNVKFCIFPGSLKSIEVPDDITLGRLVDEKCVAEFDWIFFVNGTEASPTEFLNEGDLILGTFPIRGEAILTSPTAKRERVVLHTQKASELIVVDPYLYNCVQSHEAINRYAKLVVETASIRTLRRLEVFYGKTNKATNLVRERIHAECATARCEILDWHVENLHDRFWIADGRRGIAVGTSLNGMGKDQLIRIDELSPDEVEDILAHLSNYRR
jgi:hypothetical protein